MEFRVLNADEIEVRITKMTEKGAILLLYKDARCDMRVLDETVGTENWQRKHYDCKGNLFCSLGINCDEKWIWKDDCGSESYSEKEKGEASDSFKRASFNWGIGRELYTAPFIWVDILDGENIKWTKFKVLEIKYNSKREISKLIIVDEKGNKRCSYTKKESQSLPDNPDIILCKICSCEIKAIKNSSGEIKTASEFSEFSNNLCKKCYKDTMKNVAQ